MGTGGCSSAPRVWVVAACDGMISLFEKCADGHVKLIRQGNNAIASSTDDFRHYLQDSVKKNLFSQLIVVGDASDISWTRISLPEEAAKHIVAEIEYPLVPRWFRQSPDLKGLSQALEQLFQS